MNGLNKRFNDEKKYYNKEQESYDVIVVGTVISGGWAANHAVQQLKKKYIIEAEYKPKLHLAQHI